MKRVAIAVDDQFRIAGGLYPELGTVVRIEPPYVYAATSFGVLRFDANGYECNTDGTMVEGHYLEPFALPFRLRLSLRHE